MSDGRPGQRGFTLVEVMVASILLALTVSAVAIMIANSSNVKLVNDHYRQARIIAQEELEDPVHHFINYLGAASSGGGIQFDYGEPGLVATTANRVANRAVIVSPEVYVPILGVNVPVKKISSTVTWTENGKGQSVTLYKVITRVQ